MEWFFRYDVGLLNVLVASMCLLEVDCIVFEINNMDVNRVVYILEENINMTCSEPNIRNPQFEILHESSLVQETQNLKFTVTTQSVELTIYQVQLMDGGEYTCRVRSMDSTDIVTTASLTLNVQTGGTHCLYNDSSLNWNEGETKNLSCYYPRSYSDDFQWQISNSSLSSFPLLSSSLYTDSVHKRILFASIGPLKTSDNGNIYQCSHSTVYPADLAASCMFGPISVNPIVATTTQVRVEIIVTSRELLSERLPVTSKSTTHTLETGLLTSVNQSGTSKQSVGVTQISEHITATQKSFSKDSYVTVIILSSVIVTMAVIIVTGIIYLSIARWKRGERGDTNSDFRSESRMQQKVVSSATLNTTNNINVGSELRDMKGSHYANKESHVTHQYLSEDVSQQPFYSTKIYNGTINSCSDGRATMESIDDGYYELNNPGTVPKS